MEPVIVTVSIPETFECTDLCNLLLSSKLAACVQKTAPITSFYIWNDSINTDSEFLLIIKTFENKISDIEAIINKHHPYDVPEIISMPISSVNKPYLNWLQSCLK